MSTVGQILAAERRRQGRSILEAAQATRIRARQLEALEKDDYATLPSPAYVKGYIQSYASFLELPAGPLVGQYVKEAPPPEAKGHRYIAVASQRNRPRARQQVHVPGRVWLSILLLVVLIVIVVIAARALFPRPAPTPLSPATTTTAVPGAATGAGPTASPSQAASSVAATRTAPVGVPFTLAVQVKTDAMSWMRVTVDGLTAYEGTMQSGASKQWLVAEEASLRIGKPSAVAVTRDGTPVQVTDADGVGRVTLKVEPAQ